MFVLDNFDIGIIPIRFRQFVIRIPIRRATGLVSSAVAHKFIQQGFQIIHFAQQDGAQFAGNFRAQLLVDRFIVRH